MKKLLFISNITNRVTNFALPSYYGCKKLGIEFHLASNLDHFDFDNNKYEDIVFHNIKCDRNPLAFSNIESYKILKKIIKDNQINYIHCNTPIGGVLGRLCSNINPVEKVIYTAHGFHFYKGAPKKNFILYKNIERILARRTDILITMNNEDYCSAKALKLRLNGNVFKVNGVGIDVASYSKIKVNKKELRKKLGLNKEDFVCIAMGDLIERKNYECAIKCISQVQHMKVHFLICGDGPKLNTLKEQIKQLDLEKRVHLLGFRSDIKELLSISDCFLFMSKQEGLPRALMEAMAAGLPCIVSDIRGNVDLVVNGKNGFLIKNNNYIEAANKIDYLCNNKKVVEEMIAKNLNDIKDFDVSNIIDAITTIYVDAFKVEV